MDDRDSKPVLAYVSSSRLTFRDEGGCAIFSLAFPFLAIMAGFSGVGMMGMRGNGVPILVMGLVALGLDGVGIWLAWPATRRECPGYQRVIGWVGVVLNGGMVALFVAGVVAVGRFWR